MAYTLPEFNIQVDVYSVTGGVKTFRERVVGNLAMGKRHAWAFGAGSIGSGVAGLAPVLLLPPLTDVRDKSCTLEPDVVDCPAESGRWYVVSAVDDIGKGFDNEHRCATLSKVYDFPGVGVDVPNWPIPIP